MTFGSALPPPLTRIDLQPQHAAAEGDERGHQQRRRPTPVIGEPGKPERNGCRSSLDGLRTPNSMSYGESMTATVGGPSPHDPQQPVSTVDGFPNHHPRCILPQLIGDPRWSYSYQP